MTLIALAALGPAAESKIDLNLAGAAELEALPGIGPERAKTLVGMRERNGGFRCVEELRALPRLTEKQFLRIREMVEVRDSKVDCAALERKRRQGPDPRPAGAVGPR